VIHLGVSDSAAALGNLAVEAFPPDKGLVELLPGNDNALLSDLENGTLDALLLHHLPADRLLWHNPVAVDGLVILMHPDNPIEELSLGQLQGLFAGRMSNWDMVGGPNLPVSLIVREPGAGPRLLFQERVMAEGRVAITALIAAGDAQMQAAIAADPGAVGYGMMGQLSAGVRAPAVEGVVPNPTMATSQTYPLSAPVYFVSKAEPTGAPRGLLAWLQSDEGQAVVGELYGRVR
jgi:phosphate transport system substrate-binding protein